MQSYVIHFIRNTMCEGNLEGRYIGRTESPIADIGIERILNLKRENKYPQAMAFYASPSTRCVDTLKIIYPHAHPEVILEMAECDFGEWENKTAQDLKDVPEFKKWIEGGVAAAPPGGESSQVFSQRVCRGFEILVRNMIHLRQTSVVLSTHAGVIMTILAAYGLPQAQAHRWICEPACGYSMRITPSLWMRSSVAEVFDMIPKKRCDKE